MPSRLFLSWPGCATSAGTARSVRPPIAEAVERDRRGARAAIGGIDIDRIGEHFDRQAGGLGGFLGQHHRACAGVEHHRDARAVDAAYATAKSPPLPAHDFDRAAMRRGAAGNQFGQHAVADRHAARSGRCSRPPAAARSRPRTAALRAPAKVVRGTCTRTSAADKNHHRDLDDQRRRRRGAADWRSASWSLLAISTASESAMPSSSDQSRRRLMASPVPRRLRAARRKPRRQFRHDARAFVRAHARPARDFLERAPAAEAKAGARIERANFHAGAVDRSHRSLAGIESGVAT